MICIAKTANVPAELTSRGVAETIVNCRMYDANPVAYNTGKLKFTINPDIYGHQSVKKQLIDEQHGKCCYCEADFMANGYGDVEHFRPKAGFTITRSSKLVRPGYYWLTYDWKSYFPLYEESKRAKNHSFDFRNESNLLIDPSIDDPLNHITFNRHVPIAKDKRGELSIAAFGLDRPELNNAREKYLQNVENFRVIATYEPTKMTNIQRNELSNQWRIAWSDVELLILRAKAFMSVAKDATQPFTAMVRANLP